MERIRSLFYTLLEGAIGLIFPKRALIRELERRDGVSLRNSLPAARAGRTGQDVRAIFEYRDLRVRALVWEIKYRGNARLIAAAAEVLLMELHALVPVGEKILLVPIPLSSKRLRERGFNQVERLVAAVCAKDVSGSFENGNGILTKRLHTAPQTELSREDRLRNLTNAFTITDPARVHGRYCVVVDDVATTGATLREARQELYTASARKVECLALAH